MSKEAKSSDSAVLCMSTAVKLAAIEEIDLQHQAAVFFLAVKRVRPEVIQIQVRSRRKGGVSVALFTPESGKSSSVQINLSHDEVSQIEREVFA